jgi:FkbM family methyltransferase
MRHLQVVMAAVVRPEDLCVDVGANVGTIAQRLVALAPAMHHVLVEPVPELAERLTVKFPGCEVHGIALSDREGEAEFTVVVDRLTRSGLDHERVPVGVVTSTVRVRLATLDRLLDGRRPRFVKIDVEGSELDVLRGAADTLEQARPHVVFEHGPVAADRRDRSTAIHELFAAHGYRLYDIDGAGPLGHDGFVQAAAAGRIWNFLAVPREVEEPHAC